MSWTDLTLSFASADRPLHAGICVDGIRGNLSQIHNNAGFDIGTTGWSDGDTCIESNTVTSWEWLDGFGSHIIPIRRACGTAELKDYTVTIQAKVVGAETVTLRCCLFDAPYETAIASGDVLDACTYADLTGFGNLGQVKTGSIEEPPNRQMSSPDSHPSDVLGHHLPRMPIAFLRIASQATGADVIKVHSVRIQETC